MKKFLLLCGLSLWLFVSCATSQSPSSIDENEVIVASDTIVYLTTNNLSENIVDALENELKKRGIATERVYSVKDIPDISTKISGGSCFSISPTIAVTNSHVIKGSSQFLIIEGNKIPFEVLYNNKDSDIAIIKPLGYEFPYSFNLSSDDSYQLGDDVYAIGYPITDLLGTDARVTKGIVNAKSGFGSSIHEIQISAQIQPGNSGGPVIRGNNIKDVIGIASSSISDIYSLKNKGAVMQDVNFAIKSEEVQNILDNQMIVLTNNNYPSNLEEAAKATAMIYTEDKPVFPFGLRLYTKVDVDTTYYGINSFSTLVSISLISPDVDNSFYAFRVQSGTWPSPAGVVGRVMRNFLNEFEAKGKLK